MRKFRNVPAGLGELFQTLSGLIDSLYLMLGILMRISCDVVKYVFQIGDGHIAPYQFCHFFDNLFMVSSCEIVFPSLMAASPDSIF